jgi:hypothetical protein
VNDELGDRHRQADTTVVKALRRIRMPQTQRNRELGLPSRSTAPPSPSCSWARSAAGRSSTTAAHWWWLHIVLR